MASSLNYRLTIQLALDGFSYALFDIVYNRLIAWDSYHHNPFTNYDDQFRAIEKAINAKELNENNPSVTLIIDGRTNVLVPEAVYRPDDNNKLLEFNFNTANDLVAIVDPITKYKIVNVFGLPQALQAKIVSTWPEAKTTHSSSLFLENLPESEDAVVYVNVKSHNYDLAIMKDRLLFFNNFQFNDKNDFTYFLLNALDQNKLSGSSTTVCFSGQILPSSEIIGLCRHYVKDIQFVEKPKTLLVNSAFVEIPYQYYHIHYQAIK